MQMKTITDVTLDLYGDTQYYMASAKQGDKATRYLRVQLMNNGNEFQIPDNAIVVVNIKKPDGKFCYNECTTQENRVMVQLTNQALAAAGTAYCDIELRNAEGELILSSAVFTIEIEPNIRNDDAIESSNEMKFLDKRLENLKAMSEKISTLQQEILTAKEEIEELHANYIDALSQYYAQITAYIDQEIANLINGAPSTLDTLGEIAQAMQNNADVVEALNLAIGTKASAAEFDSYKKSTDTVLGNTSLAGISDGTVTGAIKSLNTGLGGFSAYPSVLTQTQYDALPSTTKNTAKMVFVVKKE